MNPKITDRNDKRACPVGASTGIGPAVARALAGRGATLALSSRQADKLTALGLSLIHTSMCIRDRS